MQRMCVGLVLALGVFLPATFAQEFTPPPQAERDYLAAIAKLGGRAQVDGDYRIVAVLFGADCTNEEMKGLAHCERLTSVTINSQKIDDDGIAHLKPLKKLTSVTITSSDATVESVAALREALPGARIISANTFRAPPPANPPAGGIARANRAPAGLTSSTARLSPSTTMLKNAAVQDDLKLTPEQRAQIVDATNTTAVSSIMKLIDEKVHSLLTPEQKSRMKQLELQQVGVSGLLHDDIARQLLITDQQSEAIRQLNTELGQAAQEKIRAVFADRDANETAEDFSKKLREKSLGLNKDREVKLLALLNENQRKVWQEMNGPKGPEVLPAAPFVFAEAGAGRPAMSARSTFTRYDRDNDGLLTEAEFPATNTVRKAMAEAGFTFAFPIGRDVFVETYTKYAERNEAGR